MGVTGSGKTSFISHFAPDAKVGYSLASCTSEVGIYDITVDQHRMYLIDTPGFDDTNRSDTDILREVADWLNKAYEGGIKLAGIIYLHRIIDNRMSGSAMKNLRMFKMLCGDDALSCVVLATTMWNQVSTEQGAQREHELRTKPEFWAGMISKGSRVMRQDNGAESAREILRCILSQRHRVSLDLQREMASGKTLDQTAAGRAVQAEMEAMERKYKKEMENLRRENEEARLKQDMEAQAEIAAIRADMEDRWRKDVEDHNRLRVDMETLRAERAEELAKERELAHELQLQHEKKMHEAEAKLVASQFKTSEMELKLRLATSDAENAKLQREKAELERKVEEGCSVM
ncbi:uncharacterized protein F5Z01DRAFT_727803 [Emericellopsis atlantica]|uniref:G domain-containing protein n=1 Tax=Emericellopsis atlantica TaxID=2614577 RepID=A0A9P7ZHV4_9HYPO|nr:uncharacterized protein F5Z01DRAFT_727803 [Emericellopsis atlantica]KAG9251957.1 hypothetical protein F5Z01DRAFT_727803 [Emericellopsis atlantica]